MDDRRWTGRRGEASVNPKAQSPNPNRVTLEVMTSRQRLLRWGLGFGIWVLGFAAAHAQFFGELNAPIRRAPSVFPDRNFVVCRLAYRQVRTEPNGGGWRTDYPYGEINLTIRLSELTRTAVRRDAQNDPNYYVVTALDEGLFQCPFLMASDVGTVGFTDEEADRLRTYFLKGGFLWVDDFWGDAAWDQWSGEIGKVLPPAEFAIEDVPIDDPIFRSQFIVPKVPQITNIRFWRSTRGAETSERGEATREVHFRGIRDHSGRLMVVMTHNTDVGDSWEREGEDPAFFYQFSPNGYALGINVLLHAMTH